MRKWSRDHLLTLVLSGVVAAMGFALLGEWRFLQGSHEADLRPTNTRASGSTELPVVPVADFTLPVLEAYPEMVHRPLFMENRRPGVDLPVEPPPPPPPTPMNLKLMGMVHGPAGKTALLIDGKGKYQRKKLGDKLDGWTLVDLGSDRVTMEQGEKRELLTLLKKRPKSAAGPQPPVPPPMPQPGQPPRPPGRSRPPMASQNLPPATVNVDDGSTMVDEEPAIDPPEDYSDEAVPNDNN